MYLWCDQNKTGDAMFHRYCVWAFLLAGAVSAPLSGAPVRVLILTGHSDELYHHWRESTPFLRNALEKTARFDVKVEEEVDGITARTLEPYDVLVLNYQGPRWSAMTEKAVEDFVRSGKGMLAFHGVSYGEFFGQEWDKNHWISSRKDAPGWVAYPKMLGMTWIPENIGHAPRHVFTVKWTAPEHPMARGLDPTFVANDELYHRISLYPTAQVLATAYDDPGIGGTGKAEPIIWTVQYGTGRVVYITLGHDLLALSQPGVITAMLRGTEWAATGNVSSPPQ